MNRPSFSTWRPTTTYFLIGGLALILVALVVSYAVATFKPTTTIMLAGTVYDLWIADDDAKLQRGLSGVDRLPPNGGLLMKFPHDDTWGIWMKDMKVPIDIIWLNQHKRVVYIVKNASPELSTTMTFNPKEPARYVLELPAGSVDKAAIKSGNFASFDETDSGKFW